MKEWLDYIRDNALILTCLALLCVLTASSCLTTSILGWAQWRMHQALNEFKTVNAAE